MKVVKSVIGFIKQSVALFILILFGASVAIANTTVAYNFNTANDLTTNFNSYVSSGSISQSLSGGISNSGSINAPGSANAVFATKSSYSIGPVNSTYTFTANLKSVGNSGYSGVGFTALVPAMGNASGVPYRPTDALGISVHGGGFVFHNGGADISGSWGNTYTGGSNLYSIKPSTISDLLNSGSPNQWYKVILKLTRDSSSTFDALVEVWSTDSSGTLLRPAEYDASFELRNVTNTNLINAASIYSYINFSGDRVRNFDNFQIDLAGGPSVISAGNPVVLSTAATESGGVVSVSGNVTSDGGSSVTERGFVYGTSTSPTTSNNKISIGTGTGTFSGASSTLGSGTYYFRAFATNSTGTSYGSESSVTIVGPSLSPSTQTISGSVNSAISNSSTITASNFTGSVTYAVTSGSLPAGLAINSSTGVISGTPTASSSSTITVTGTGATAGSATTSVTFAIAAVAPSAPVINSITAGDGRLSVNFTAASNGGSAITNYEYSINGSSYTAFSPAVTTSPLVITGLTNSTNYPVTIKAVNAINPSSPSNSISATPVAATPSDSGGSSSSSSSAPTPTPTPSASVSVKPRVERINTNPLNIPVPGLEINRNLNPGSRSNPEQLVKTDIQQVSDILKPKVIDLGKTLADPSFEAPKALQLITGTEDKKVVDLASLVTNGTQIQSSRLVIVDNTSAQVITPAGGVLAVQAKDGDNLVPVNNLGRVQMIKSNTVETQGSGLAPNSEFAVYLFSKTTLLGIGKTDSQGKFYASFQVTGELPIGDHTLQVKGELANGQVSSVSIPVSIVESVEVANSKAMPKTILIDVDPVDEALDAVYWLFFVLLVIVILAVLTNRQKFFFFLYRKKN